MLKELSIPQIFLKDGSISYGGNQEWFAQFWKRSAGCACTCGVNIAAYYAFVSPVMRSLYKGNTEVFDQKEFVDAMEEMLTYMKPGFMGYPYVKKLAEQFIRFCRDHGVAVESDILETINTTGEAISFVKESIDAGHPVALLILLHRAKQLKEDIWHWVTVTGYIDGQDDGCPPQIIISNCGVREVLSADIIFEIHKRNKIRMAAFRNLP